MTSLAAVHAMLARHPLVGWTTLAAVGVGETAMFACPQDVRQMSGCEIEARWAENS